MKGRSEFADLRKLTLHPIRRTALHLAHEVGDCELWRHGHEHVDTITRQDAAQYVDLILAAYLAADIAHPKPKIARQDFVAILCRPDDVVAVIKNAVFSSVILHGLTLREMNLRKPSGSFLSG